jgi:hypothetical protein
LEISAHDVIRTDDDALVRVRREGLHDGPLAAVRLDIAPIAGSKRRR